MSAFIFDNQVETKCGHRGEVPAGIESKAVLMEAIFEALKLPDYFGRNWDALCECICDLSWLPPGDVILTHQDLPLSEDRAALSTYLMLLKDAMENWNTTGSNSIFASPEKRDATGKRKLLVKRKFLVMFPSETKNIVQSVVTER